MRYCAVKGCQSNRNRDKKLRFYSFPRGRGICQKRIELATERRKHWFAFLKRDDLKFEDLIRRDMSICAAHFVSGKPAEIEDESNVDWIPSLFPPAANNSNVASIRRSKRLNGEEIEEQKIVEMVPVDNKNKENEATEVTPNLKIQAVTSFQTDIQKLTIELENLKRELKKKTDELIELRKINDELSLKKSGFVGKDDKLKCYTGLPDLKTFQLILDAADHGLNRIRAQKLDNFQKLLMCMMKLRLNLHYQDLAYRFDISAQTASLVFQRVMVLLKHKIQYLINWPDQEYLKSSMPRCFVPKFGDSVVVVIDCFEISAETSAKIRVRNQSCSDFEQKCTTKYLIGVTPYGTVSFISNGFDGYAKDVEIIENSGFLDKLVPGNVVLANRGFHLKGLKEAIAMKGAEMKTLDASTVEESNDIASVRNHAENLIYCVKQKYTLLDGPVSFTLMNTSFENVRLLDCAVHVACMLSNLCDSVVSDV